MSLSYLNYSSGVALIAIPVNPDTLHALMRLMLRLTLEYEYAAQFATLGGTKHLLQLRQSSGFQGFTSLATLLFRHVLEEPSTLRHTLEKVRGEFCRLMTHLNIFLHL